MIARICISFLLFACFPAGALAQKNSRDLPRTGYGFGLVYNVPVQSFGPELKARIPIRRRLYLAPELSYFLPFSPIHELYAGAAAHYELPIPAGRFSPYLAAGAYYNNWMNVDEYRNSLKDRHNFAPEAGAGIILSYGCVRPYLESRYDIRWREATIRIGLLFYPGDCRTRMKKVKCPAYG